MCRTKENNVWLFDTDSELGLLSFNIKTINRKYNKVFFFITFCWSTTFLSRNAEDVQIKEIKTYHHIHSDKLVINTDAYNANIHTRPSCYAILYYLIIHLKLLTFGHYLGKFCITLCEYRMFNNILKTIAIQQLIHRLVLFG